MTGMMGLIWNCSIGLAMIRSQSSLLSNAVRRSKAEVRHRLSSYRAGLTIPAARIRLSIPAQKPSIRQTIRPQGDVPNRRSTMPTQNPAGGNSCNEFGREPEGLAEGAGIRRRTGARFQTRLDARMLERSARRATSVSLTDRHRRRCPVSAHFHRSAREGPPLRSPFKRCGKMLGSQPRKPGAPYERGSPLSRTV